MQRLYFLAAIGCLGLAMFVPPAMAHHSIAGQFDTTDTLHLTACFRVSTGSTLTAPCTWT